MTETANGLGRALVAEFIGTFALIFIGAGSAIALPDTLLSVPAPAGVTAE